VNERQDYHLLWGDLHNHNAIGYAEGSLERSIEIARSHLDFFAFTAHACWHDIDTIPPDRRRRFLRGFEVVRQNWSTVRRMINEANEPGRFTTLVAYEWHSSRFGDYCLYYPGEDGELFYAPDLKSLQEHARKASALLIPHHLAYAKGMRGVNWDLLDPTTTPVVEIYSEHGCSESDRGPYPMFRHSMGGRSTESTVLYGLAKGLRFGFIASTDDHLGFPGAYGEGLAGVWAAENTRKGIFEALKARRTYAVTGDRIALWFELNGQPMGSELGPAESRQIRFVVEAWDAIEVVELIRNGEVLERFYTPSAGSPVGEPQRLRLRIQYGWGPWSGLHRSAIADWHLTVAVENGKIISAVPCWQSGPFDPRRRDAILEVLPQRCRVTSFTGRRDAFAEDPTKSLLLELEASPATTLHVATDKPEPIRVQTSIGNLVQRNVIAFAGPFGNESLLIHRALLPHEYRLEVEYEDRRSSPQQADWYYIRVKQANGQMAWSSPIWVEPK